jgi:uncharacterized protein (TIGR02302 family)
LRGAQPRLYATITAELACYPPVAREEMRLSDDTAQTPSEGSAGRARVQQLAARAVLTILWERVWPGLVAIATLIGLFLAVSWFGLWLELPRWGRIGGLGLFAVAVLTVLFGLARIGRPTRDDALARLDRDSGLPHRPASGLSDRLANAGDDPATRALWQLHRRRLLDAAERLKLARPSPRMVDRDRYAVRAGVLVAMVAAGFIAGPEKFARVAAAFDWRSDAAVAKSFRLDAWIDPPPYTGKPPILLPALSALPADGSPVVPRKIQAPVGSSVVVRSAGDPTIAVDAEGGLPVPKPDKPAAAADKAKDAATAGSDAAPAAAATGGDGEHRWALKGDAKLVIRRGDQTLAAFDITSIPDRPPVIAETDPPTANVRGSLTLAYKIGDDYGVNSAEATFAKPVLHGKPIAGRSLVEPPKLPLTLPTAPGGIGDATTTADLSEHPWAGAHVTMTLSARDDGGNVGESEPVAVTLPQRPFVKPLAKALVEQRRNLVLAPDDRDTVLAALEALLIAPERFTPEAGVYLGLVTAATRLKAAKTDDDLRGVADFLWEMALQIEDGDLSDAERALRAAEQRLREAMQRGASDEELRKLSQELRAALDKFLNEMAQQQMRDQDTARSGRPSRTVTPQDLKSMLDRLDEMARSGDLADAQQMLDQLQSILENLKNAKRGGRSDPMAEQMDQQLDELDRMTRDQQGLRDDTFRKGQQGRHHAQRQRPPGQPGQPNAQGQPDDDDQADNGDQGDDQSADSGQDQAGSQALRDRQQDLRKRLEQLRQRMKQLGMNKEQGLDDAEGAMGDAEQALSQGQSGSAVDAQGRALEGLRRGAEGLAKQMQGQGNQQGQGEGDDDSGAPGNPRGNRQGQRDPLDRPSRYDRDFLRGGLLSGGPGAAQRAQQVLEELRRRLSDPSRPQEELDYLDRLLRRY